MIAIIFFLLGLAVGSFINCLVYRLEHGQSIWVGRSACPRCKRPLGWLDLVPVISFCCLRGQCRQCHQPINWKYPVVEFLSGLVFVLPWLAGADFGWFYYVGGVILLLILSYDLWYKLIPDKISFGAIAVVTICQLIIHYQQLSAMISLVIAGSVAAGFFLLQFLISKGRWIGGGDIRLGFLIGLVVGWPNVLIVLMIAYILGSLISLPLVVIGRAKFTTEMPFGVFLNLATIIVLIWGTLIINWYRGLLYE